MSLIVRSAHVPRTLKMRNILNVLKLNPSEPIKDSGRRLGLLHGRVGDCPFEQHQEAFFGNFCVILRNPLQTKPYWLWKKSSRLDSISRQHILHYVPYLYNEVPFLRPWKVLNKSKNFLISLLVPYEESDYFYFPSTYLT